MELVKHDNFSATYDCPVLFGMQSTNTQSCDTHEMKWTGDIGWMCKLLLYVAVATH